VAGRRRKKRPAPAQAAACSSRGGRRRALPEVGGAELGQGGRQRPEQVARSRSGHSGDLGEVRDDRWGPLA
jgi:hypothetical protein